MQHSCLGGGFGLTKVWVDKGVQCCDGTQSVCCRVFPVDGNILIKFLPAPFRPCIIISRWGGQHPVHCALHTRLCLHCILAALRCILALHSSAYSLQCCILGCNALLWRDPSILRRSNLCSGPGGYYRCSVQCTGVSQCTRLFSMYCRLPPSVPDEHYTTSTT